MKQLVLLLRQSKMKQSDKSETARKSWIQIILDSVYFAKIFRALQAPED